MSNKVRELRVERGLRREELAVQSGVPWRTIQAIEQGGGMRMATAVRLARALNVTLDELIEADA